MLVTTCTTYAVIPEYGSGHEGAAVLLPDFAISWLQNQVTRQPHIRDLTHMNNCTCMVTFIVLCFIVVILSVLVDSSTLPYYTPLLQRSWKGVYWFHLVRLSVCGQNRVRSISSTILIGSISYLHILSSNFRRCVPCNVCFKIQKFEILSNSLNF